MTDIITITDVHRLMLKSLQSGGGMLRDVPRGVDRQQLLSDVWRGALVYSTRAYRGPSVGITPLGHTILQTTGDVVVQAVGVWPPMSIPDKLPTATYARRRQPAELTAKQQCDMDDALEAVAAGVPYHRAAEVFEVPGGTLYRRAVAKCGKRVERVRPGDCAAKLAQCDFPPNLIAQLTGLSETEVRIYADGKARAKA